MKRSGLKPLNWLQAINPIQELIKEEYNLQSKLLI